MRRLAFPRVVVITGASGGLGQELAASYAVPGRHLLLCGRNQHRLEETARRAVERGADVECLDVSLVDSHSFGTALSAFDARAPIDLFIANAGVKTGNVNGIEDPEHLQRVIAVNLTGTLLSVQAALSGMTRRGRGHIAIVSSLAARSPHADLLSYSATKAALEAYTIALRRSLIGSGVSISLIRPGFIDTPMTHRHAGKTPFVVSAPAAALRIKRGLDAGHRTIAFPRRLDLLVSLRNTFLPPALSDRLEASFRANILPDEDERKS